MQPIQNLSYLVYFQNSLEHLATFLLNKQYSQVFVLTDTNTTEYCLPTLREHIPENIRYDLIEIDAGEENKNIDFCIGIWKTLLDFGADRKALLINLGGGVVTDMGAFAASTYKRGIDFIQIPTTLLAQVDASVGGKTGIDLDTVKNIIGTFAQPQAVYIDTNFLTTLDTRQIRSGFAEIIKHGLIFDASYFQKVQKINWEAVPEELIYRSIQIKNEVVTQDPTEQGLRKILNFGHTIGHAIESYFLDKRDLMLLHGEAVALGMISEAYLSNKLTGLSIADLETIVSYISSIYPIQAVPQEAYTELVTYMKNDKKNNLTQISCSLLRTIGVCGYDSFVSEEDIIESLNFLITVKNR